MSPPVSHVPRQYFTGAKKIELPHPGGFLQVSDLRGEYSAGTMTTFATISLPTAEVSASSSGSRSHVDAAHNIS